MLTSERLREILAYDSETGDFIWRALPYHLVAHIGKQAGRVNVYGYRKIQIDRRCYLAHRLAWLYTTGRWPKNQIDHRNRDRDDNRWSNLREATGTQNLGNRPGLRVGRLKGVSALRSGKYQAQIKCGDKNFYLGLFDTEQQAHDAYMAKARELFGEFARAA